ncbi:MAG: hypothetical protein L6R42_000637 [Xanthoria sp. 1 TBL-2021]|nr:MAG: hypothetical protein L6R42_000637 [Xanthoria sp. 1 TBL-2021]
MPIFQDPEQRFPKADRPLPSSPHSNTLKSKTSEESIRTEFCDGFLPDVPPLWNGAGGQSAGLESDGPPQERAGVCTSDRNELMERIKRGESATWVPSEALQEEFSKLHQKEPSPAPPSKSICCEPNALLPSAEFQNTGTTADDRYPTELSPPLEIKRPRSALHAGDFTRDSHSPTYASQQSQPSLEPAGLSAQAITGALPAGPWNIPLQPHCHSDVVSPTPERPTSRRPEPLPSRNRAPSLSSLPSSYVVKAPTTPLVQQSNNTDLDFSPIDRSMSPSKINRRHTLPPRPCAGNLERIASNQAASHASAARQPPIERSDPSFPHQTHRPRRSLTTTWSLQGSPSPQGSTFLCSRRQSLSSEASPLQNASMVGSYEESILRGWMSTAPSKPLNFTAQIGVMGKGSCKPKCPAHVTVPFPAVFYSWNGGIGRQHANVDDEPSPYVGHIDLSQLPAPAESKKTRRSRSKSPPVDKGRSVHLQDETVMESDKSAGDISSGHKKRRRISPPPSSLQGGYRIPQKGQLQIVIKNPNKTAVKLFLVPYDLGDMPMATKTFIRQRCYSTDPIFDGLSSVHRSEPDVSFGSVPPKGKPTLRYLIHVNICSPSSGRFYLYQIIRVVFANRVPDNKEQLQTEIQTPQPRYSAYSLGCSLSRSLSGSGAGLAREKAYRRRSSGLGIGNEGTDDRHPQAFACVTNHPSGFDTLPPPVPGIPCQFLSNQIRASPFPVDVPYSVGKDRPGGNGEGSPFPIVGKLPASPTPVFPTTSIPTYQNRLRRKEPENQRPAEDDSTEPDNSSRPTTSSSHQTLQSPLSDKTNVRSLHSKRSDLSHHSGENRTFSKLSRWDEGYGGRPSTPAPRTGLLTKKLRGLGVQMKAPATSDEEMDELE